MSFTIYAENEEKQIHNDRYHGKREVTTYRKIKVHTNEAPPICEVTKNLEREKIDGFTYSGTIIRLRLDEIELMQCRVIDKETSHVDEILNFLQKEGYDPTQQPPAVVNFRGKYYLINGHHQYDALKKRGQALWIFDLYDYDGIDDPHIFESLLKGLGKRINLVGSPPKKDQTPKELGQGYVLEIKNNFERTGIAFLEYDKDTGVPIPISKDSLRRVLIRDGFTSRWDEAMGGGKASVYTRIFKFIMAWDTHNTISGIRSFDDIRRKRILKTGKFKENGKDTIDGMKGYVQSTNDPDSKIARFFGYIISNPFKCRILSYSTVTDDADAILKNEITLRKGLYKMYVQSIKAHNLSLPDIDEKKHTVEQVRKFTPAAIMSRKDFEKLYEWWAVSQLDDEEGEVIQRKSIYE